MPDRESRQLQCPDERTGRRRNPERINRDQMDWKQEMNRGQTDAVRHAEGPCVVIAPPGSGKTAVLTRRVCELTARRAVPPHRILVITFTRAAAAEMRERYLKLSGKEDTEVLFGTFHSVFLRILRQSLQAGAFLDERYPRQLRILSEQEKKRILTSVVNSIREGRDRLPDTEQISEWIGKRKSRLEMGEDAQADLSGGEEQADLLALVFRLYCEECARGGRLDLEDITRCCRDMLKHQKNEGLLNDWRDRFRYILIDEFQDISPMQFALVRMLAWPRRNLFVVGDDDQAIYGFRGSEPRLMLELGQYYPDIRTIFLETNYRSGKRIVHAALRLIGNNRLRYPKTVRSGTGCEGEVRAVVCAEKQEQEHRLLEWLGARTGSVAVIVRTNAQAAAWGRVFDKAGVRTAAQSAARWRMHPAVKDFFAYLMLADAENGGVWQAPALLEAMLRVAGRPYRAVARYAVIRCGGSTDRLYEDYEGNAPMQGVIAKWKRQLKLLGKLPPSAAVEYVQKGIGYEDFLLSDPEKSEAAREEALQALARLREEAKRQKSIGEWLRRAAQEEERESGFSAQEEERENGFSAREERRTGSLSEQEGERTDGSVRKGADKLAPDGEKSVVRILTMHACKGLEFDHVAIPDVNEGMIPYKRAFLPEELEEERRLFYVAMTRAKKSLLMTCVHKQGNHKMQMSRFMKELIGCQTKSR